MRAQCYELSSITIFPMVLYPIFDCFLKCSRKGESLLLPYRKPTPSEEPVPLIRPETAQRRITVRLRIMAKRSWPESMRNAALLGLMQPNLETGALRTGRYTLFGLAGVSFREIGHFVWNLLAFARRGSVGRCWKVFSLPFFDSVQYSMEIKSTKRRINRPRHRVAMN